jgi:hypothetical protein
MACGVHVTNPGTSQDMQADAGTDAMNQQQDAASPDAAPLPCNGSDQVQSGSSCFTLVSAPLPYGSAASACVALDEHLAIVRDGSANAAIGTLLGSATIAFLGGTEEVTLGTWLWTDNSQFWSGSVGGSDVGGMYTNWGSGEPNDGAGKFNEWCLTIRGDDKNLWDDRPCGPETGAGGSGQDAVAYAYVCERP